MVLMIAPDGVIGALPPTYTRIGAAPRPALPTAWFFA
jgi:hypothetical protein